MGVTCPTEQGDLELDSGVRRRAATMCQPPKPPTKACGACGLEKDASCYSKKQFAAKATRRCRDCLAKNADVKEEVAISRAPGPLAKTICWDLYYLLLGAGKDDASPQAKKEAYLRATQGLTEPEIRQDDFSDREAACMAALRGMALLDTPCGADGRPAALVLVSRATLWLARAALRARPLEFDLVAYNKMFEDGGQPLHIVLKCYTVALRKFPQAASLCLALYAHACIRAVAAERGSPEVVRPAWGEAWLVRAEVEVFLGELHAAAHAKSATGRRPLGRLGPDKDDKAHSFLDDDALLEQTSQWEVSVPGYAPQRVGAPGSKAPSTHLATYWWGLEEKVAKVILAKSIGQALGCLERCHGACKADERKRLETRHRDCEVQAFRRGAAALAKIGAGRDAHAKLRALVFCLEALGDSDEGPLVTADVLLPRAVACVAEAKVPHLRAELAYVDAFARDDVLLGAEGYALTTLSCALDVLADGDDSGEQPVLDLGGESWPAPPAPPPASPLGGEDWPEPS